MTVQFLDNRPEPPPDVPDFGRPSAQEGQERPGAAGGPEEMGQGVGPLGKLDGFDPGFIEQHPSFEHVHWRRVEPRAQVHVLTAIRRLPLNHSRGGFAGEAHSLNHVVVRQDSHRAGPLERGQGGVDRATRRIVERDQPGRFAGPENEMGQALRPVEERPDDETGRGGGHRAKIASLGLGRKLPRGVPTRNPIMRRGAAGVAATLPS